MTRKRRPLRTPQVTATSAIRKSRACLSKYNLPPKKNKKRRRRRQEILDSHGAAAKKSSLQGSGWSSSRRANKDNSSQDFQQIPCKAKFFAGKPSSSSDGFRTEKPSSQTSNAVVASGCFRRKSHESFGSFTRRVDQTARDLVKSQEAVRLAKSDRRKQRVREQLLRLRSRTKGRKTREPQPFAAGKADISEERGESKEPGKVLKESLENVKPQKRSHQTADHRQAFSASIKTATAREINVVSTESLSSRSGFAELSYIEKVPFGEVALAPPQGLQKLFKTPRKAIDRQRRYRSFAEQMLQQGGS